MTALSTSRMLSREKWNRHRFLMEEDEIAYQGGIACIDLATGTVKVGAVATTLFAIGTFAENKDATGSAVRYVDVILFDEIEVIWFANGSTIDATDTGSLCYIDDDQTVSTTATGKSVAGRIWAVETTRGVAVQLLSALPTPVSNLAGLPLDAAATFVYTSNDYAVANNPPSGTVFDVATTGAASTISLPATAVEGTVLYFVADGTKNGHTVTYRDVATAISAALTASKRHQAIAIHLNNAWTINTTVSP